MQADGLRTEKNIEWRLGSERKQRFLQHGKSDVIDRQFLRRQLWTERIVRRIIWRIIRWIIQTVYASRTGNTCGILPYRLCPTGR